MGRADVIAQAGDSQPSSSPWEDPDQADLTLWLTCASLFLGAYIPGECRHARWFGRHQSATTSYAARATCVARKGPIHCSDAADC